MTLGEGSILLLAGIVAGIANVVAGGGSLLAVPIAMLAGPAAHVANASSRPAIIAQCLIAVLTFRRAGILDRPDYRRTVHRLALLALPGALLGAWAAATPAADPWIRRCLGLAMLVVGGLVWRRRLRSRAGFVPGSRNRWAILLPAFLAVGVYGGFIQAGVGFVIFAVLAIGTDFSLPEITAARSHVILIYTILATVVFARQHSIDWSLALWLIVGQSIGGWLGSRIALVMPEKRLLDLFVLLVGLFAASLLLH